MSKIKFLKHYGDVKVDEFLMHYGVLGMKWGRRKSDISKSKGSSREKSSEDYKTKVKLSKKSLKELSDSELKKLNSRLSLEKSYKKLTKKEKSKGKKIVEGILLGVATEAATKYVRSNVLNL
jgi:hypothetical protein